MQADSAVRRQKAAQLDLQIVEGAEARKQLKKDLRAARTVNAELEALCRSLQSDRKAASAAAAAVKAADLAATATAATATVATAGEQESVGGASDYTTAVDGTVCDTTGVTAADIAAGAESSALNMNSTGNSDNSGAAVADVNVNSSSNSQEQVTQDCGSTAENTDDATAGNTSAQGAAAVSDSSAFVTQHNATEQQQELDALIADTIKTSSELLNSINTQTDTVSDNSSSVWQEQQQQQQAEYNVDDAFSGAATTAASTEQGDDADSAALVNNMADFVLG
eukprot:8444-Heterococcus_DN1.PRE.1